MFSDAMQDEFAIRANKFERGQFFLDIGSCDSIGSNNTAMLEIYHNWTGICVELNTIHLNSYNKRKCRFLNENALNINYSEEFSKIYATKKIGYLSLDIDDLSIDALKVLPHDEFRFNAITIEHDYYIYGEKYRQQQRNFLNDLGYFLLFGNVLVQQEGFEGKICPFEDWWVDPNCFDVNRFLTFERNNLFPSDIISLMDRF